jgi:hypothetical protein
MRRFFVLHARMQSFLREWDRLDTGMDYAGSSHNVVGVEFLRELQASLGDPLMEDAALTTRLHRNHALLEQFACTWQAIAAERHPGIARFVAPAAGDESPLDVSLLRPSQVGSVVERA